MRFMKKMNASQEDLNNRTYIAIDLKSFYASVECLERGLDPLTTNLVVADESRTTKTICLAVSPSLKAYGISGRARLFEVVQRVKAVNAERRKKLPDRKFSGASYNEIELQMDPSLELTYIAAPPRMAHYMDYSTRIYQIYLKYIAPEDIHVYSIDEVFMDVTEYLNTYGMTPKELAMIAAKALDEKKGKEISVIEITDLTTIADYFIIASGTSNTQINALSGAVEKALQEQAGEDPLRREGYRDGTWVLLDYGCIVVHIFSQEAREFYSLERLWGDGKPVDLTGILTKD